jgi:hypothetical protein
MEKEFCYLRKDCWNCIIDYLDINSMLQLELTSKNFKIQIDSYYETKEKILKYQSQKKHNIKDNVNLYKYQFISKYFNFVLNCSLKGKEFCNDINENEKNNDIQFSQKGIVPKSEIIFFGNK